jgi:hypothetical protein
MLGYYAAFVVGNELPNVPTTQTEPEVDNKQSVY